MELPEDTFVLVLEPEEADTGWAKVIFEEGGDAFRTWVHPDCVRTQRTEMCNIIHVEHTDKRGTEKATVDIGTRRVVGCWMLGGQEVGSVTVTAPASAPPSLRRQRARREGWETY